MKLEMKAWLESVIIDTEMMHSHAQIVVRCRNKEMTFIGHVLYDDFNDVDIFDLCHDTGPKKLILSFEEQVNE